MFTVVFAHPARPRLTRQTDRAEAGWECQADRESALVTNGVEETNKHKKRHGVYAKRELSRQLWKPSPVRVRNALTLSAQPKLGLEETGAVVGREQHEGRT